MANAAESHVTEILEQPTGIVPYDTMCRAIAECTRIDHVQEIKSKARAMEVYAHQIQNTEAERGCVIVRLRAERRMGQLLKEMGRNGERAAAEKGRPSKVSDAPTLPDLGITRDQSSQYQKLADIPEEEFEEAISDPCTMPSTEGVINRAKPMVMPPPSDPSALWAWGRLKDFERQGILDENPQEIFGLMTVTMQEDVKRIAPLVVAWLSKLRRR